MPEDQIPRKENDPVHFDEGGWWFWDETWSGREGPFESRTRAREALSRYCVELDLIDPEARR